MANACQIAKTKTHSAFLLVASAGTVSCASGAGQVSGRYFLPRACFTCSGVGVMYTASAASTAAAENMTKFHTGFTFSPAI
ncbi:hypothetical protein D3C72_2329650 [compost metagenome]